MRVSVNKASMAAAATLAVLVLTNVADAGVSLGFPKGRPYYGSSSGSSSMRSYRYYAPSQSTADETRQSFSYEPSEEGSTEGVVKGGCCCGGDVAKSGAAADNAKDNVAAKPEETRQSYSYEPEAQSATQSRRYSRRSERVGEPWQYQRTDPRRHDN